MVLYTGKDTFVFNMALKSSPYMSRRKTVVSTVSTYIDNITYLMLFIGVLTSGFVYLGFYMDQRQYELSILLSDTFSSVKVWQKYFQVLSICCALIPVHLNVMQEIIMFITSLMIHSETSKAINLQREEAENTHRITTKDENDNHSPFSRSFQQRASTNVHRAFQRGSDKMQSDFDLVGGGGGPSFVPISRSNGGFRTMTPRKRRNTGGELIVSSMNINATPKNNPKFSLALPETTRGLIEKSDSDIRTTQLTNISAITTQRFLPGQPEEPPKQKDPFGIDKMAFAHVTNYTVVSELGSIDHVLFDKTDTLTENVFDILSMATWKRSYMIELNKMKEVKDEFMKNPEAHRPEDVRDNKFQLEDDFYSEKSQELGCELEAEIIQGMFDEDPEFKEVVENIRLPFYMPVPVGYAEEQERRELNKQPSIEDLNDDSIISNTGSKGGKLSSKVEDFLITKGKGRLDLNKIEQLLFNSRKDAYLLNEDMPEEEAEISQNEEELQGITDGVINPKPFPVMFYDNHSRSPEMETLVSILTIFLFCGMVDLSNKGRNEEKLHSFAHKHSCGEISKISRGYSNTPSSKSRSKEP